MWHADISRLEPDFREQIQLEAAPPSVWHKHIWFFYFGPLTFDPAWRSS